MEIWEERRLGFFLLPFGKTKFGSMAQADLYLPTSHLSFLSAGFSSMPHVPGNHTEIFLQPCNLSTNLLRFLLFSLSHSFPPSPSLSLSRCLSLSSLCVCARAMHSVLRNFVFCISLHIHNHKQDPKQPRLFCRWRIPCLSRICIKTISEKKRSRNGRRRKR